MFFQSPKLPEELMLNILNRLPLKEAISFLLVSKEMSSFIKDDSIWNKFGANNFNVFATRMKALPENFRQFILKGQYNYTLEVAEDIIRIQKLPEDERLNALLDAKIISPEQATGMSSQTLGILLGYDNGITALREGLITAQQATVMNPLTLGTLLRWDNGITALRECLLTLDQAINMNPDILGRVVLSDAGIVALRKLKLISGAVMNSFTPKRLSNIVSLLIENKSSSSPLNPSKHLKSD